jgi:hypothetical protein
MNTNILDYLYEGYGYGMDDQLLYTDEENYDKALAEESKMSVNGMETLSHQGVLSHESAIEVEKANEYTELGQFIGENGANYTDLRQSICGCN